MRWIPKALSLIVPFVLLAGCGADPNYATPEKTVATYIENGPRLRNAVDIAAWNFAWNGLSKTSQQWFEANWETICDRPSYREACGAQNVPDKQKMVAFGAAVADRGPSRGDEIDKVNIDGNTAEVKLKSWPGTIFLVKEGKNWKIDRLFGAEKVASNQL
ncbi:MAG: hypothetical protein U0166_07170 [Acidobacteriota bacterium]